MKTEKLYYQSAYVKEFTAAVVAAFEADGKYIAELDKTAFFPEEGGQYSDTGFIGDASVVRVFEKDKTVFHEVNKLLSVGERVQCSINFEERFDKMQQHTAEHILSGIFHSLFGVENTGFHLGAVDVTFDTSRPMKPDELALAERLANEAVMRNLPVSTSFPAPEELSGMEYRSKLELTEDVRIVTIGDVDSCACCAPHVGFTGEIGFVKIIDAVTHRGGSRIRMLAGKRAYEYVRAAMDEVHGVSVKLSAKPLEISAEVGNLLNSKEALKYKLTAVSKLLAECLADKIEKNEGDLVVYTPLADKESLRTFVNCAKDKVGGTLVALFGEEGGYSYLIHSAGDDFSAMIKNANSALSGKGGGKAPTAEGRFCASLADIRAYFEG